MTYNGHPSRNYWNVALWIGNDEGLYRMALDYIRRCKTRDHAAAAMLAALNECGVTKTPDGSPYTKASIRHAMTGLE